MNRIETKIVIMVTNRFAAAKESDAKTELIEELSENLYQRFLDLTADGYPEDKALEQTFDSLGDVKELLAYLREESSEDTLAKNEAQEAQIDALAKETEAQETWIDALAKEAEKQEKRMEASVKASEELEQYERNKHNTLKIPDIKVKGMDIPGINIPDIKIPEINIELPALDDLKELGKLKDLKRLKDLKHLGNINADAAKYGEAWEAEHAEEIRAMEEKIRAMEETWETEHAEEIHAMEEVWEAENAEEIREMEKKMEAQIEAELASDVKLMEKKTESDQEYENKERKLPVLR